MPHLDQSTDTFQLYHAARAWRTRVIWLVCRRGVRRLLRVLRETRAALNAYAGARAFRAALY